MLSPCVTGWIWLSPILISAVPHPSFSKRSTWKTRVLLNSTACPGVVVCQLLCIGWQPSWAIFHWILPLLTAWRLAKKRNPWNVWSQNHFTIFLLEAISCFSFTFQNSGTPFRFHSRFTSRRQRTYLLPLLLGEEGTLEVTWNIIHSGHGSNSSKPAHRKLQPQAKQWRRISRFDVFDVFDVSSVKDIKRRNSLKPMTLFKHHSESSLISSTSLHGQKWDDNF